MVLRLALFLLLVVALIAVSVFGLSILNQSRHAQVASAPVQQTEQVLVASTLLSAGALVQPGDLSSAGVPVDQVPDGASLDTPANRSLLIGSLIRSPISPGAPILNDAIIHPGDHGFLAAVLAPGMRATTIGVDAVSGAAGLIWPGDHVDVLLTQTLDDPSVPLGQRIAAELVMKNVRVIATGQQLVQGSVTTDGKTAAPATTVTLEVTTDEAERVAVASRLGPLSLVVISSEAAPVTAQNGTDSTADAAAVSNANQPVWADEVSPALSNVHGGPGVVAIVHVYSGSDGSQDYKF
jgi:pilus assembly protein CpaB